MPDLGIESDRRSFSFVRPDRTTKSGVVIHGSSVTVIDVDHGWNELLDNMREIMGGKAVDIGFFARSKHPAENIRVGGGEPDHLPGSHTHRKSTGFGEGTAIGRDRPERPTAYVAACNEFGVAEENIPERPFMRVMMDDHEKDIMEAVASGIMPTYGFRPSKKASPVATPYSRTLAGIGMFLRDKMREYILAWDTPPNAPLTVKKKGFNDPLMETGRMMRSVDFRVRKRLEKTYG